MAAETAWRPRDRGRVTRKKGVTRQAGPKVARGRETRELPNGRVQGSVEWKSAGMATPTARLYDLVVLVKVKQVKSLMARSAWVLPPELTKITR